MAILVDALVAKFAAQDPPLDVAGGIRQATELDESHLAMTVEEIDAYIMEQLDAHEKDALLQLNSGRFPFPCPVNLQGQAWPTRTEDQRADQITFQTSVAAEAVQEYVMGDLFLKASVRDPARFESRAYFYLGDKHTGKDGSADIKLKRAVNSVLGMGQDPPIVAPVSNTLGTALPSRGDYGGFSEYGVRHLPVQSRDEPVEVIDYHASWWLNR